MGSPTPSSPVREVFRLRGIARPDSAAAVASALAGLDGVVAVSVDGRRCTATVQYDPELVAPPALIEAVVEAGFGATRITARRPDYALAVGAKTLALAAKRVRLAWLLAGPSVIVMVLGAAGFGGAFLGPWQELALALPVLVFPGRATLLGGFRALREKAPNGDTLVAVGVLVALASGIAQVAGMDIDSLAASGGVILATYLTGRFLELRARASAAGTAEPSPEGGPGAGPEDVALPAALEEVADQIAAVTVPLVLGLALLAGVLWITVPAMMEALGGWAAWLPWTPDGGVSHLSMAAYGSVAVLVIACPWAMGLAVPAAIGVGINEGARRGIAIRDGATVQRLRNLSILCFKKSGTLSRGAVNFSEIAVIDGWERRDVLTWAAAVTLFSDHPAARAISEKATRDHCLLLPVSDYGETPGLGGRALVDGAVVLAGKPGYLAEAGVDIGPLEHHVYRMHREAKTVVAIARGGKAVGVIGLTDFPKPDSVRSIKILRRMGLKCIMITGDEKGAAEVFADQCGIERVIAGVLPGAKARAVAELKQETIRSVGMVGQGAEDGEILAAADVGIALGTAAAEGLEAADVAIGGHELMAVVEGVQLAKAAYNTGIQNLFWAFGYNLVFVPLAMVGGIHPVVAVVLMCGGTLVTLANALRLRRFDAEKVTQEIMRR